jgi:hypothetical protein
MASSKGFTGGAGSISPAGQNRQVAQHTAEQAAAGGQ